MVPTRINPQLYLSRNDRPQPGYLIWQRDMLVATLTDTGRIHFTRQPVRECLTEPGDDVYVPARVPHLILSETTHVQRRYKAHPAGLEALASLCDASDAEVWCCEFDTTEQLSQVDWHVGATQFNGSTELRTCRACSTTHSPVGLDGIRCPEVAKAIAEDARAGGETGR